MKRIDKTYQITSSPKDPPVKFTTVKIISTDCDKDIRTYLEDVYLYPHYVIDRKGKIYSIIPEDHITDLLDNLCLIALMNRGPLMRSDGKFYPIALDAHQMPYPDTTQTPEDCIYEYCTVNKYRGFAWYQNYTTEQLASLYDLLLSITKRHGIPRRFDNRCGEYMKESYYLAGGLFPGVYLGNAFSKQVTGAHPSTEMQDLLKKLALQEL